MHLKKETDPVSFLKCAQKCKGEVCFCTSAGDTLNLKSMAVGVLVSVCCPRRKNFD